MRIYEQVRAFIDDEINQDKIKFMAKACGGWERWLQMELAYWIAKDFEGYSVALESREYTDDALRADMMITRQRWHDEKNVVELKCEQANADPKRFVKSVLSDIQKAQKLKDGTDYFFSVALIQKRETLASASQILSECSGVLPGLTCFDQEDLPLAGMLYCSLAF